MSDWTVEDMRSGRTQGNRIYGIRKLRLIEADGVTVYPGQIHERRVSGRLYYATSDGRWFDNAGMPVGQPQKAGADPQDEEPAP